MDKNTVIGLSLIFVLFMLWQSILAPSEEQIAEQQRVQDSIALAEQRVDSLAKIEETSTDLTNTTPEEIIEPDSIKTARLSSDYGPFAAAAQGEEQNSVLENNLFKITFSSKGGRIKDIELKEYFKLREDEEFKDIRETLKLLEDEKNKFEYFLPLAGLPSGGVSTEDLYFSSSQSGNTISLRADAGNGRYFEQQYTIRDSSYRIDYKVNFKGLNNVISRNENEIQLTWLNYLDKLEKNTKYERNYSTLYYKPLDDDDPDNCSCTSDDTEDNDGEAIKWVSYSNQFFNTTLIAETGFKSGELEVQTLEVDDEDLKKLNSSLKIPYNHGSDESFAMTIYAGPNEFDRLYAMDEKLEDVIPFGTSIFGTINRWIIRPLFNFLSTFIGSKGIVILFLTFIVKLLLYPLTFRMLYSQSKMAALKPRLEGMKDKFKDDSQKQQMETMKLYREFGVNPLGGCMPMVLQMPIWFALYRFFPAAIEFRQASFLWATDLSSYDVIARLPFEIPMGFGAHISLFTMLWAVTTLIYTYYNTKHMDMSANPAMKYMQYLMPIFFMGFFNSFASGLTCYLLFSNLFNIGQTIITKNYIIDKEKINRELEAYKKKPKKKGGFQARLETALKEQQRIQAEKESQTKKKKK